MPINPNIALAVKGIELQDPLAQYGKVATIQNAQQQNQLAQMQMQQSQRDLAATNALNQAYKQAYNADTGEVDLNALRSSLATGGFGSKLPGIEKSIFEGREAKTKALKGETDLLDAKLKQSRQFLETIDPNDPASAEAYMAWHRANHADPVIGKALEARGITVDQSMQRIQQLMQTPGGLARLIYESKLGTDEFMKANKPVTSVGPTGIVQTSGLGIGDARVVPGTSAAFQMTPAQIAANKIAQGQLAVSQGQLGVAQQRLTQDAQGAPKPLTEAQSAKRRDVLGKEFKAAQNALQTTQDVLDSISFVKAEPGLSRATGFMGTLLPSMPEGQAASAETRLKNLEGKITALGKAQAASTGTIGSIANQEWKILADQIAAIDRTKGTGPLLSQLELVEAQARGAMERIQDAYQRQFGEDFERFPQFESLPPPKSSFKSKTPAASGGLNAAEQAELDQLRKRFGK
jgi:hypothetical protein